MTAKVHSLAARRARIDPGVTKRALAAELGVSQRTIERWGRDPTFPVNRFYDGLMVRYDVRAARAWREARGSGTLPASQEKGTVDAAFGLVRVEAPPAR